MIQKIISKCLHEQIWLPELTRKTQKEIIKHDICNLIPGYDMVKVPKIGNLVDTVPREHMKLVFKDESLKVWQKHVCFHVTGYVLLLSLCIIIYIQQKWEILAIARLTASHCLLRVEALREYK